MNKIVLKISFGLLLAMGMGTAFGAVTSGTKTLSGHVPKPAARLAPIGTLPTTNVMQLSLGLPLRNQAEMQALLAGLYDPASTNFHKFLTTEEFTARFGPTAEDYQTVLDFARSNGLTVTQVHPNRLLVSVAGQAADVQNAFHVTLKTYNHPKEARTFYAPDTEPTVSSSLPIFHVSGMDNYNIPHPMIKPSSVTVNATHATGSGPAGSFEGSDFRKAYVPGTTLTGAGQNVALLQFDGFYASDIQTYATQIGLTNVPNLVVVPVDGGVSIPTPIGVGEVSLDIEMVLSMSPGVSNIYVYEAPNPSPWVDLLSKIANDNLARQVSSSWAGGTPDASGEQIFQQMQLQGQSFFNASGDYDAFNAVTDPMDYYWPCDSPNITLVGGTTLTTDVNRNFASETVWNWGIEFGIDGFGSSGGSSAYYAIPSWQTNVDMVSRGGSTTMRNSPDVALTADNVWVIYGSGQTGAFGGTSCASPLWAGFMALANQQAVTNGHAAIGFLNPQIYKFATNNTTYTNCFRDVTTGNNVWSGSPNLFYATNNYDLCTGLGSPNGTNLINALTVVTNGSLPTVTVSITAPQAPWGTTLSALAGDNPNGPWYLFLQDVGASSSGIISNGWYVTLTSANPVGYAADNELIGSPSFQTNIVGGHWSLALTVTNYGPSISSNIVVSDTLPTGLTLTSTNLSAGSVTLLGTHSLVWSLGTMAVGSGATLNLQLLSTSAGTYTNTAVVSAGTDDPNSDDNATVSALVVSGSLTPPTLTAATVNAGNGSFSMSVTGSSGVTTVIQASTNLVTWVPVYTNMGSFTFTNTDTGTYPHRFYRAISTP